MKMTADSIVKHYIKFRDRGHETNAGYLKGGGLFCSTLVNSRIISKEAYFSDPSEIAGRAQRNWQWCQCLGRLAVAIPLNIQNELLHSVKCYHVYIFIFIIVVAKALCYKLDGSSVRDPMKLTHSIKLPSPSSRNKLCDLISL
jgi:hypothetical protein